MSDLEKIKNLRQSTGAGFKDCSSALKESAGDIDKAIEILRIKGVAKPILKNEEFIFSGSTVQSVSGTNRVVKCELLRLSDNSNFFVSEMDLMSYFSKSNKSSLGGHVY